MPEQAFVQREPPAREPVPALEQAACHLCGLPVGSTVVAQIEKGTVHRFCCPGCKQVYAILAGGSDSLPENFRETEIYRACVEANIIPGSRNALSTTSPVTAAASPAAHFLELEQSTPALDLSFRAGGMWCPACAWLIGEVLGRIEGVLDPQVSFFSDTVRLRYFPHLVTPKEILAKVGKLGYQVFSPGEKTSRASAKSELLLRLGISSILTMNAMMLSCVLYLGFVRDLTPTMVAYFSYPLLVMTVPVVFYGGMPIFRKAWAGIRFGSASMDTLITVGALAAFSYSLLQMARGSIHLYFDTAAMLITIVLLGRYIEMHARERILSAVGTGLGGIGLQKTRLVKGGIERWVAADAVIPGDHFIVRSGEMVTLDGRIVAGQGLLDQSVITGEPVPAVRGCEEDIMAGSLLVDGELEILANRSARESSLQQMADLMVKAVNRKDSREQLADAVSRLFVPLVMALTAFTASVLWFFGISTEEILLRCLAMLLISCPCAIGVAVPIVKVAIIGLGSKKGILVRNSDVLEQVLNLDTIIFDKTGTLTEGKFVLLHVICDEADEREILCRISAIEAGSSHFLAREILRRARGLGLPVEKGSGIEEFEGLGVTGMVGGEAVFVGNRRLLTRINVGIPPTLEDKAGDHESAGLSVIFFGWEGKAKGFLVFGDRLRLGAKELVRQLRRRGLKVKLLSGDGPRTTAATAQTLGITDFLGQAVPVEKADFVRDLQREGHKVGMVGDGINDAGALAQADVSFAIGASHHITNEASDVIILGDKPDLIIDTFELSALSVRTTRQNLCFAFLYNSTAIPVAAAGLLNPLIAVLAMFMSSLTVIGNALRLLRKGKEVTDHAN